MNRMTPGALSKYKPQALFSWKMVVELEMDAASVSLCALVVTTPWASPSLEAFRSQLLPTIRMTLSEIYLAPSS